MPLLLVPRLFSSSTRGSRRGYSTGGGGGEAPRTPRPQLVPVIVGDPKPSNFDVVRDLSTERQSPLPKPELKLVQQPRRKKEPEPSPLELKALNKAAEFFALSRLRVIPVEIPQKPKPVEAPDLVAEPEVEPVVEAPQLEALVLPEIPVEAPLVMLSEQKPVYDEESEILLLLSILEDEEDLLLDQ